MSDTWSAKVKASLAAGAVLVCGLGAKVAHLGPFAETALRNADVAAMGALAFRDNVSAMRSGTLLQRQAVDVACAFFTSLANTGEPPPEFASFRGTVADRAGLTTSSKFFDSKVERLALAVELAQRQPRAAVKYLEYCL